MALEQDIANLVQAANDLTVVVDNKIQAIEQASNDLTTMVDNKIQAVEQALEDFETRAISQPTTKTCWVNQAGGDDANTGDESNPLASITEAVSRAIPGGRLIVRLLDDYRFEINGDPERAYISNLCIVIHGAHPTKTQGRVDISTIAGVDHQGTSIAGGIAALYGVNSVEWHYCDFKFLDSVPAGYSDNPKYCGFVSGWSGSGGALTSIAVSNCSLSRPAGSYGYFITKHNKLTALTVNHTTFDQAEMNGNWVGGKTTGDRHVITNLASY